MRVWIDLANSPHVPLMAPVVARLRQDGHQVVLSARDHAQTLELARARWPDVLAVGGPSPAGRLEKGAAIARRAAELIRLARRHRPDVAFSHGSYAQIAAAPLAGVPAVTMMDYEHQPANHLSFRLARRVIVPETFPSGPLRRCGASGPKVVRYRGFKEQLYLGGFEPDPRVLEELGLDPARVIVVLRPPPDGALYHRSVNERFDRLIEPLARAESAQLVLLPRGRDQAARYGRLPGVRIPTHAVDGSSLVALADVVIGGGGTMNRESALLGTPTYTVFAGRLAAVDAELIRLGRMRDLRAAGSEPVIERKPARPKPPDAADADRIMSTVLSTLGDVSR